MRTSSGFGGTKFYEGNFALEDYFCLHKNIKIYEGNFALQAFCILTENRKIYECNIALQAFFYLENFELFDGPSVLRSKILAFQNLICSFVNRNVSKKHFQIYLKTKKPSTNQHQKY